MTSTSSRFQLENCSRSPTARSSTSASPRSSSIRTHNKHHPAHFFDLTGLDTNPYLYPSHLSTDSETSYQHHEQYACMNGSQQHDQYPSIRIQQPNNHYSQPLEYQDHSLYSTDFFNTQDWPIYQSPEQLSSYQSPPAAPQSRHARQPSESSIASTAPGTPFAPHTPFTFIANADRSPAAVNYNTDVVDWAQTKYNPYQQTRTPLHFSNTSVAHAALKDMAMDHHTSTASLEEVPELYSSRQSNSSHGRNTPNTPRGDEQDERPAKMAGNGTNKSPSFVSNGYSRIANAEAPASQRGHLELYRTESAAFQDELFNPQDFSTSAPSSQATPQSASQPQKNLLTPHGNLVNEIVGKANQNRSHSPQISREKSPFRQQSEHYPRSPAGIMPSAARIRQQQKEEADQKEYAAHQPTLRREPTQTMSPKDAVKDYDDSNPQPMSLFTDIIPEGYEKHLGGTETFQNNFISGTNQAYGQFVPVNGGSNVGGFRGVDLNNFLHSPMENNMADATSYANQPFASQRSDKTPEFPAQLTSMESSASENLPASQESAASPIQRPARTSADTGTYTCTYHGCTQRFESPIKLQKHKREQHQSQSGSAHNSHSPSASPEVDTPSAAGMTSSDMMAKNMNTQNGPHKCSRINPTTGKPCNTIFSRPYDLTRHEDTIHNKGKQKVRCQYCREEKTFSRNDALTRHMRVVHPDIDFQGKRPSIKGSPF